MMTTNDKTTETAASLQDPDALRKEAHRLMKLADEMEGEGTAAKRGRAYVAFSGAVYIHRGTPAYDDICLGLREATVHEVDALYAAIPEFARQMDRVRGGEA